MKRPNNELVREAVKAVTAHGFVPIVRNGGKHVKLSWTSCGKLARFAYESRTGKTPPAFTEAHFEQANTGAGIETYSAIDLGDEQEAQS